MIKLVNTACIDAAIEKVWAVLADLARLVENGSPYQGKYSKIPLVPVAC